ncbi:hypothetical protein DESC_780145 [Desulfosarcina cetonica]|nr:hypothetical protein DESC_780145 [Desulfosarcina cetonica]
MYPIKNLLNFIALSIFIGFFKVFTWTEHGLDDRTVALFYASFACRKDFVRQVRPIIPRIQDLLASSDQRKTDITKQ